VNFVRFLKALGISKLCNGLAAKLLIRKLSKLLSSQLHESILAFLRCQHEEGNFYLIIGAAAAVSSTLPSCHFTKANMRESERENDYFSISLLLLHEQEA